MSQSNKFNLDFTDDGVTGAINETAALDPWGGEGGEGIDGDGWPIDDPKLPVEGDIVGEHYRLVSCLGEGMFGRVYVAERTDIPEHLVALKVMTRVVYAGRNVERELVMLAAASHPHIVQLKDHGMTDDYVWLSMPLYEGETLAQRIERGPLSLREAYEIFLPIARGVHALHERGLRHQDIKPENIFLAKFGRHVHPVLLDLGVAVERTASFVAGTILYAAPEQVAALAGIPKREQLDEKIDTYCLATTLLRSLIGPKLFGSDDVDTPFALAETFTRRQDCPLANDALPDLTGAPREALTEAFGRWLAYDPDERPNAAVMATQLDVLLDEEREAAAIIEAGIAQQKTSLHRVRLALAGMALLGAGSVLYGFSKRETLRLASELEQVRAEGKVSFNKLDTCVASHAIFERSAATCKRGRHEDESAFHSTLTQVTTTENEAKATLGRRLANTRDHVRRCETASEQTANDFKVEKGTWISDRAALVTSWELRQNQWVGERGTLNRNLVEKTREVDAAKRAAAAAQKEKATSMMQVDRQRTARDECREDMASCIQDRDTCMNQAPPALPAPVPAPPIAKPQQHKTPSQPNAVPTPNPAAKPTTKPDEAPPAGAGTTAAPSEGS